MVDVMENPIKMDELGVPPIYYGNLHMKKASVWVHIDVLVEVGFSQKTKDRT